MKSHHIPAKIQKLVLPLLQMTNYPAHSLSIYIPLPHARKYTLSLYVIDKIITQST